jgi:hypothetical protein
MESYFSSSSEKIQHKELAFKSIGHGALTIRKRSCAADVASFGGVSPYFIAIGLCEPSAGETPTVCACRAGRARDDPSAFGVGSESATGIAPSQNPSSADLT